MNMKKILVRVMVNVYQKKDVNVKKDGPILLLNGKIVVRKKKLLVCLMKFLVLEMVIVILSWVVVVKMVILVEIVKNHLQPVISKKLNVMDKAYAIEKKVVDVLIIIMEKIVIK